MKLHELKPARGSTKTSKRIGRGNAAGQGTTAGKGSKGEKARSGGLRVGFRGMSSRNQRMAKRRGFTNRFKQHYDVINVGTLQRFEAGSRVDLQLLKQAGLVRGHDPRVKILGDGDLSVALHLEGIVTSRSARQKIEAAGGSITAAEALEPPTMPAIEAEPELAEVPPAAEAEAAPKARTIPKRSKVSLAEAEKPTKPAPKPRSRAKKQDSAGPTASEEAKPAQAKARPRRKKEEAVAAETMASEEAPAPKKRARSKKAETAPVPEASTEGETPNPEEVSGSGSS